MSGYKCYLCGCAESKKRPGKVRDSASLEIRECCSCGLVFLSSFEHIKKNFYQDSKMHAAPLDTAASCRATRTDDLRRFHFLSAAIENREVLDFGCGNGGFLRKANKLAARADGLEIERGLKKHHKELGLNVSDSLTGLKGKYDLITAFHVIEHIADPVAKLKKLARLLKDSGEIIVEVPSSADAMLTLFQSKAFSEFTYWSCHLYLFNSSTLGLLAQKAGLRVNYIKHIQRYPVSNHLHWLSKGVPGGHQKWSFLDSPELHAAYEKQLASLGATDTVVASFS
ncbi:MAG TPA: methyltransferase [Candidatus Omnitrophica bacterium]|nr:methyltransferase [Candidatus Omnitrophota bacterium]